MAVLLPLFRIRITTAFNHPLANLLSKRTLAAQNNFTPSATHTTTTVFHQPHQTPNILFSSTRSISPRQTFTQTRWKPFFFFFISGSFRAAQNNICSGREGKGKDGKGQDRPGKEGRKGKRILYGQALGSGKVWIHLFSLCPPIILWVCSLLNNLKTRLLSICALIQRCLWRGERALFRASSSTGHLLRLTLTTVLLLRLVSFFLLFFWGCHLFVSMFVTTTTSPSRWGRGLETRLPTAGMESGWKDGGLIHMRVLVHVRI
jgi:lysylphosphatidylglycerol synthetase-like protein (DUF2156 family)